MHLPRTCCTLQVRLRTCEGQKAEVESHPDLALLQSPVLLSTAQGPGDARFRVLAKKGSSPHESMHT